jgi:hypothetical protein
MKTKQLASKVSQSTLDNVNDQYLVIVCFPGASKLSLTLPQQ